MELSLCQKKSYVYIKISLRDKGPHIKKEGGIDVMTTNEKMVNFSEKLNKIEKEINIPLNVSFELKKKDETKDTLTIEIRSLNKTIAKCSIILISDEDQEINERLLDDCYHQGDAMKLLYEYYLEDGYLSYLENIWVDENYRNNGIATLLMKNIFLLIEKGSNITVSEILITPSNSNERFFEDSDAFLLSEKVFCIYKNIFIK